MASDCSHQLLLVAVLTNPSLSLPPTALHHEPALQGVRNSLATCGVPGSLCPGWVGAVELPWGMPQEPHGAATSGARHSSPTSLQQRFLEPTRWLQGADPCRWGQRKHQGRASLAALGNSYSGVTAGCFKEGLCPSPPKSLPML